MSPEYLGLVLLGSLLAGIFIGFPISFTLIILALVFGYIGFGSLVFDLMVFQSLGLMKEETFAAIPLFVFMGRLLEHSGLMERLFKAFQSLMGGVRGSLYVGALLTATIFATATGVVGASVVVIGIMAAPAMVKSRYNPRLSAGVITAGGTLGVLIPPSVMLVVIGPVVGVSVVKLYWAAIVPGLILAALFCTYALVKCHIWPEMGPPVPVEERITSKRAMIKELLTGIVPISCIILAALGTIVAGMATPTEAAAMAASGSMLVTFIYGKLTWAILKESALTTLETVSMILFLATAGNIFGAVFTRLGTSTMIAKAMLALPLPPMGILAVLMLAIFLLGWPLEWPAIVFIFLPIFLPVVEAMKLDPLWFSALVSVNLQTAFLSPPVAMAAYYLKSVAPEWELSDIYKGMAEFMVLQMIGLAIVFFFPEVALWLPRVLM